MREAARNKMWVREISPECVRAKADDEECTTSRLGTRRNSGVDRQAGGGQKGWAHAQLKGANGELEWQPPPLPLAEAPECGCGASRLRLTAYAALG
ncbi:unnamed protein product [Sphagnum compactum]